MHKNGEKEDKFVFDTHALIQYCELCSEKAREAIERLLLSGAIVVTQSSVSEIRSAYPEYLDDLTNFLSQPLSRYPKEIEATVGFNFGRLNGSYTPSPEDMRAITFAHSKGYGLVTSSKKAARLAPTIAALSMGINVFTVEDMACF